MKLLPILFAWLSLLASLAYIHTYDWHDIDREREWDWYWGYADNLIQNGKYQDCTPEPDSFHCAENLPQRAYRLPGYPAFLAGVMVVAGEQAPEMVKALQAVMMSLMVFMTVHLAYRVDSRHRLALVTGILMLGAPNLYWQVPIIMTEILFAFVLMVFMWAFVMRRWRLAGLLWGGSLLIRTSLLFATPFLLLFMPRRRWWVFGVGVAMVLLPLTIRNTLVLGTFAPFGTNGGTVLKAGHNPESYQTGEHVAPQAQSDWSQFADLNEVELDRALRQSALEYAKTHFADLPLATARKLAIVIGAEGWLLVVIGLMVGILKWRRRGVATNI